MASPSTIALSTSTTGEFAVPKAITEDSAKSASELLQENHEKHHILFNKQGMHSKANPQHIVP